MPDLRAHRRQPSQEVTDALHLFIYVPLLLLRQGSQIWYPMPARF